MSYCSATWDRSSRGRDLHDRPGRDLPEGFIIALMRAITGWKRGPFIWVAAVFGTTAVVITVLKLDITSCRGGASSGSGDLSLPAERQDD
jgi:hypothetical protein